MNYQRAILDFPKKDLQLWLSWFLFADEGFRGGVGDGRGGAGGDGGGDGVGECGGGGSVVDRNGGVDGLFDGLHLVVAVT